MCNRSQNDVIWGLLALLLTDQTVGNTIDFKMNAIRFVIPYAQTIAYQLLYC